MRKVSVLQHTKGTPPGSVLPWLAHHGFAIDHRRLDRGDPLPLARDTSTLVLCGGGINVDQEDRYPWLRDEKKLIETVLRDGGRVLGLCLGGQLLAEVLGAKVGPHHDWEVGWHDIDLYPHPRVQGFEEAHAVKFFQWHRYRFELPAGAFRLAGNDWWPNQAFAWESSVGFQFHPEATREWVAECAADPERPTTGRAQDVEEIMRGREEHLPRAYAWFGRFLDGFFLPH